jgi:hypothetical protein
MITPHDFNTAFYNVSYTLGLNDPNMTMTEVINAAVDVLLGHHSQDALQVLSADYAIRGYSDGALAAKLSN